MRENLLLFLLLQEILLGQITGSKFLEEEAVFILFMHGDLVSVYWFVISLTGGSGEYVIFSTEHTPK